MGDVLRVYSAARRSIAQVYAHDAFRRRGTKIACRISHASRKWARELMEMFEVIEDDDGGVSLADAAPWWTSRPGRRRNIFKDCANARASRTLTCYFLITSA